jgi:hypothetical protein
MREKTLDGRWWVPDNCRMRGKTLTFRETLNAAAKNIPGLWDFDNDKIRLPELSRYLRKKGCPVSQPTLHRHYNVKGKPRELSGTVVEALHSGLGIPRSILRGEAMAADLERALVKNELSTLLLAERIEALPHKARLNILAQIEEITEREEHIKHAMARGNVTPIDRTRDR